jgi:dTDP-4-amino-4,6-dideoxygalactose transaminase
MSKIPLFKVSMSEEAILKSGAVMMSGQIAQGPIVNEFERVLRTRFGNQNLITVNSCTSAIDLALHLCGVGVGPLDEVITTAQTCLATNSPILNRRATPVFADIDPVTGLIDPDDVANCITKHTKAIVAVDWAGRACNYAELRRHGIPVIEDAAHAVGTLIRDEHVAKVGGDYVCFSFQAIKHLTTGDGGALVVPPEQLERAKRLRWFGLDRETPMEFRFEQNVSEAGYKYHMNDISAAIGLGNEPHLSGLLSAHISNARSLCDWLSAHHGRLCSEKCPIPSWDPNSSWWLYTIHVDRPRDFIRAMSYRDIECSLVHTRNDTMDAFRHSPKRSTLKGLESFSRTQVSIPVGWWLSPMDIERICEEVLECAKE